MKKYLLLSLLITKTSGERAVKKWIVGLFITISIVFCSNIGSTIESTKINNGLEKIIEQKDMNYFLGTEISKRNAREVFAQFSNSATFDQFKVGEFVIAMINDKYVLTKILKSNEDGISVFLDGDSKKIDPNHIGKLYPEKTNRFIKLLPALKELDKERKQEIEIKKLDLKNYLGTKISPQAARKYATFSTKNQFTNDEYVIVLTTPSFGLENRTYDLQQISGISGGDVKTKYTVKPGHDGKEFTSVFIGKLATNTIDEFAHYLDEQIKKTKEKTPSLQERKESYESRKKARLEQKRVKDLEKIRLNRQKEVMRLEDLRKNQEQKIKEDEWNLREEERKRLQKKSLEKENDNKKYRGHIKKLIKQDREAQDKKTKEEYEQNKKRQEEKEKQEKTEKATRKKQYIERVEKESNKLIRKGTLPKEYKKKLNEYRQQKIDEAVEEEQELYKKQLKKQEHIEAKNKLLKELPKKVNELKKITQQKSVIEELVKKEQKIQEQTKKEYLKEKDLEFLNSEFGAKVILKNSSTSVSIPARYLEISEFILAMLNSKHNITKEYNELITKNTLTLDVGELFAESSLELFELLVPFAWEFAQARKEKDKEISENILENIAYNAYKTILEHSTLIKSINWTDFEHLINYLIIDKTTIVSLLRGTINTFDRALHEVQNAEYLNNIDMNFDATRFAVVKKIDNTFTTEYILEVWDTNDKKLLASKKIENKDAEYLLTKPSLILKFSPDAKKIFIRNKTNIWVYDAASLNLLHEFKQNPLDDIDRYIVTARFGSDGNKIFFIDWFGDIGKWDLLSDKKKFSKLLGSLAIKYDLFYDNSIVLSDDSNKLLVLWGESGSIEDPYVLNLDLENFSKISKPIALNKDYYRTGSFSFDGTKVIGVLKNNYGANIFEVSSGKLLKTIKSVESIKSASLSPDGNKVIVCLLDGKCSIHFVGSNRVSNNVINKKLTAAKFSSNGKYIIGENHETDTVYIFDTNLSIIQAGILLTIQLNSKEKKHLTIDTLELYKALKELPSDLLDDYGYKIFISDHIKKEIDKLEYINTELSKEPFIKNKLQPENEATLVPLKEIISKTISEDEKGEFDNKHEDLTQQISSSNKNLISEQKKNIAKKIEESSKNEHELKEKIFKIQIKKLEDQIERKLTSKEKEQLKHALNKEEENGLNEKESLTERMKKVQEVTKGILPQIKKKL